MEWIRRNYSVPAKRGGRVRFFGVEGTIASATHYLRVRMDRWVSAWSEVQP
jgi:hypothetical protein